MTPRALHTPAASRLVAVIRSRALGPLRQQARLCSVSRQQQEQHPQQQPQQQQQPPQQQVWRCSRQQPWRRRPLLAPPRAAADNVGAGAGSSDDPLPLERAAGGLGARLAAAAAWLDAFYRFTRPHTMLGTAVSVTSISALALGPGQAGGAALAAFLQALVSALLMNVCIVGINQLYDIEIDRINKPYLPLAAGDFSPATGRWLVAATGAASLAIGWAAGSPPLLATLGGSLLLGIAYSTDLPLLRWKRSPVLAACCILAVRAILVQLGFFLHMQLAVGGSAVAASAASGAAAGGGVAAGVAAALGPAALSRPILFATAFMLLFSIVIALFKDIPDVAGDRKGGVNTLSVRLGPKRVFWACIAILELAYLGAIAVGLQSELLWSRVATAVSHAALGGWLAWQAARTDLSSPKDISRCYMRVLWPLFYAEYLLLVLYR